MKDKGFQVGFLFNHFPELVFFKTELFTSNADMIRLACYSHQYYLILGIEHFLAFSINL